MKIRIRYLTLRGLTLLAVSLVILFAAVNYQRNALFWTGYSVLTLFIMGMLVSVMACRASELHWTWGTPAWVFANEGVSITGKWNKLDPAPKVVWTSHPDMHLPFTISDIKPGLLSLPVYMGYVEYPLGIVKTGLTFPEPPSIWVYPAPINHSCSNKLEHFDDNDPVSLRDYRDGDLPNRILKKTQSLPESYWRTRTSSIDERAAPVAKLSWNNLPASWSTIMRAEQLSYEISLMPSDRTFSLELADGNVHTGAGVTHQHHCWQQLSKLCAQES